MQWKVTHNIPEVTAEFVACAKAVEQARPTVLRAIGVQLLSWGFSDFRDKSEGKAAGGVTWKPIGDDAVRSRLLARKPYRTLVEQGQALAQADAPLKEELRKKLPAGKSPGRAKQRGRIAAIFEEANPQLKANRAKRAALRAKKRGMIATEKGKAKIGVDTGRLVNSLIFGVPGIREKKLGASVGTVKPAVFRVEDRTVTVGTAMDYAEGYDKRRPIFGPGFIDGVREQKLGQLVKQAQLAAARRIAKHAQITDG